MRLLLFFVFAQHSVQVNCWVLSFCPYSHAFFYRVTIMLSQRQIPPDVVLSGVGPNVSPHGAIQAFLLGPLTILAQHREMR